MGIFGHSWSPWGRQRFQPNAMILKLPILQSTDHKTTLDVFCFCAKSNRCAIACFLNISSHHDYYDDPSYHHDHGLHPQFKWQSQYQIGVTVGQRFIWWKMSSHPKWGPGMTKSTDIITRLYHRNQLHQSQTLTQSFLLSNFDDVWWWWQRQVIHYLW